MVRSYGSQKCIINLKALKKIVADDIPISNLLYSSEKIRLGISCESSAGRQTIYMKYQTFFSEN